ncbi:MAG: insulinase family protein [Brockia lithotrophica]|nr:insulinase family protein [Brockia lithotrophica]
MAEVRDLPGGARLLLAHQPGRPSTALGIYVTVGSRHEPWEAQGLAHFVEHVLFKGSELRSARELARAVDRLGGEFDAHTTKDFTAYTARVLAEDLDAALDLMEELVFSPAFPEEAVEAERRVILEEIAEASDDPEDVVWEELASLLFGPEHPLGWPILGRPETVRRIDRRLLRDFFSEAYTSPNLVFAVVGALSPEAEEKVQRRLADLAAARFEPSRLSFGNAEAAPAVPPFPSGARRELCRETAQAHVVLAWPALPYGDIRLPVLLVLEALFGGSASSRLFQRVREEDGLAYSVYSSLGLHPDVGYLGAYAASGNAAGGRVEEAILREAEALARGEFTAAEVDEARDYVRRSYLLGGESPGSLRDRLAQELIFTGRIDSEETFLSRLAYTTFADVRELAREIFSVEPAVVRLAPCPRGRRNRRKPERRQ